MILSIVYRYFLYYNYYGIFNRLWGVNGRYIVNNMYTLYTYLLKNHNPDIIL